MSTDLVAEAWKSYLTRTMNLEPQTSFQAGFHAGLGLRLKGQGIDMSILKILEDGAEIVIGAVEGLKEEGDRVKAAKEAGTKPDSPLEGPGSPLSVAKAMAQGIQKRVGNERLAEFLDTIQKRNEEGTDAVEEGAPEEVDDEPTKT